MALPTEFQRGQRPSAAGFLLQFLVYYRSRRNRQSECSHRLRQSGKPQIPRHFRYRPRHCIPTAAPDCSCCFLEAALHDKHCADFWQSHSSHRRDIRDGFRFLRLWGRSGARYCNLRLGYLIGADVKIADGYLVLGFVCTPPCFFVRASHPKTAASDQYKPRRRLNRLRLRGTDTCRLRRLLRRFRGGHLLRRSTRRKGKCQNARQQKTQLFFHTVPLIHLR